jgi:uncharacterized OsmC-like protein
VKTDDKTGMLGYQKTEGRQPSMKVINEPRFQHPSLDEACQQFQDWRKQKRHGDRIPTPLWDAAVAACRQNSLVTVSRALRINYTDLKTRVEAADSTPKQDRTPRTKFVELQFDPPQPSSECFIEIQNPNGAKMTMQFVGSIDPIALSRVFWAQGR